MFIFLTVLQAIISALLVGTILMQKSEGGGLGVGGIPSVFMSARGAADFLTRATQVMALLFVVLSITLAALAVKASTGQTVDTSLVRAVPTAAAPVAPVTPAAPADPLAGAAKK